jgi:hypothetical protein
MGYCNQNQSKPKSDILIIKNVDESRYQLHYKNYIIPKKANEKEFNNIKKTKSKHSTGSGSIIKSKQFYVGDNSSTINNVNISICNNTFQMNSSNIITNNLMKKNLNSKILNCTNINPIDEIRHKNSIINFNKYGPDLKNNLIKIKTKLLLTGNLFQKKSIIIDKYGMKNGLRQKNDGLVIFGFKDKNGVSKTHNSDYYFDLEELAESGNNSKMSGRVFEIYLSKKDKMYTLYFLHSSLILYYKIKNDLYFNIDKNYFLILGDIFLTLYIKKVKNSKTKEKIIYIQTEFENEQQKKVAFSPKDMPIKIGRVDCHIEIKNPSISKLHGIIDYANDNYYYKDCNSTNGSTLLIREDDTLKIKGEMSLKLDDISFMITEIDDDNHITEENV